MIPTIATIFASTSSRLFETVFTGAIIILVGWLLIARPVPDEHPFDDTADWW